MVKSILLKCDNAFFLKLKQDKAKKELALGETMTWEEYMLLLFGFRNNGNRR